jgi:hypothetical protein
MVRVLFGLFLIAHGLIHAGFVTRAPATSPGGPEWPFVLERSWLSSGAGLDEGAVRLIGVALVVATVASFAGAGLAWLGFVVPAELWSALVVSGSVASLALLGAFFHPWLLLGLLIDLALISFVAAAGWSVEASAAWK